MGYWIDRLDRLNPALCRLCARLPHARKVPLTNEQIAQRSGGQISVRRVRYLSKLKSWENITVREMEIFKESCGIKLGSECLHVAYIKRTCSPSKVKSGSFYHIRRLLKRSKDPRLTRYFAELLAQ